MKYFRYTENVTDFENLKYNIKRPNIVYCQSNKELSWKRYVKDKGIEYVDLGLPSGRLWATKNLGATEATLDGISYAWGELTTKELFEENTYRWAKIDNVYEKYNPTDGKLIMDIEDDAARQTLGGDWRLPSVEDVHELLSNTTWTTNSSEKNVFTSKINGNTLTLPKSFHLWVNEISSTSTIMGRILGITSSENSTYRELSSSVRYFAHNIRPVI